jgi:flagellar assembly protein FliH
MRSSEAAYAFPPLQAPAGAAADAGDVLGAARAEAEAIRQAARAAGHEEGRAEGLAAARAEVDAAASALAQATSQVREELLALAARLEREAVDLALLVADKALASALEVRPERVLDAVAGGLRALVERERVVVVVHPDDLPLVRDGVGDLAAALGGIAQLDVQADRRVGRGGAVLRTADGEVDATLQAKLERAQEAIRRELEE